MQQLKLRAVSGMKPVNGVVGVTLPGPFASRLESFKGERQAGMHGALSTRLLKALKRPQTELEGDQRCPSES